MITRISISVAVAMSLTGCVMLSSEEEKLITSARLIHHQPVSRTELVTALHLAPDSAQRGDGNMRSGQMIFEESWTHSSGLTVRAFDCEWVGPIENTPKMIDGMIDGTATIPGTKVRTNAARKSFNGFTISRGDSVIYNSHKAQEGEQGSGGNGGQRP
jgi:hypothetical protein